MEITRTVSAHVCKHVHCTIMYT